MANVNCTRPQPDRMFCGRIAYVTYSPPAPVADIGLPESIVEPVKMCTTCRTQANRENEAAKARSTAS